MLQQNKEVRVAKILQDKESLFTMLVAIVKANGGTLKISEDDLLSVTKGDAVSLVYDKRTKEIILKVMSSGGNLFGHLSVVGDSEDYEN